MKTENKTLVEEYRRNNSTYELMSEYWKNMKNVFSLPRKSVNLEKVLN